MNMNPKQFKPFAQIEQEQPTESTAVRPKNSLELLRLDARAVHDWMDRADRSSSHKTQDLTIADSEKCKACRRTAAHYQPCPFCQSHPLHHGDSRLLDFYWPYDTSVPVERPIPAHNTQIPPSVRVRISLRVSPKDRERIQTHGGLARIVHEFLQRVSAQVPAHDHGRPGASHHRF